MATKPTVLTRWAQTTGGTVVTGANAPVTPNSGKLDAGFAPGEKPPAGFLNWLFNNIYLWLLFLNDSPSFVPTTVNATGLTGTGNGTGAGGTFVGGSSNGIGIVSTGVGTGTAGSFTAAIAGGAAGVTSIGGSHATQGGGGLNGTGGGGITNGAGGAGVNGSGGNGAGSGAAGAGGVFTGGTGGSGAGPGVWAIAGGGASPARGAVNFSPVNNNPSAPVLGDMWVFNSGGARIKAGGGNAGYSYISKYLFFSGIPGNVASTTYYLAAAANSVTASPTTSALGVTQYFSKAELMLYWGLKWTSTTAGGTITAAVFYNGSQVGGTMTIASGSVGNIQEIFNQATIPASAFGPLELRVTNGVGVTTGLGQVLAFVEVF